MRCVVGVFFLIFAVHGYRTPIHYDIDFSPVTGPDGHGTFFFDDCANPVNCPAFQADIVFGPTLQFSSRLQLRGNAIFLNEFFLGNLTEPPTGTNFNWDFSYLTADSQTLEDYKDMAGAPLFVNFLFGIFAPSTLAGVNSGDGHDRSALAD